MSGSGFGNFKMTIISETGRISFMQVEDEVNLMLKISTDNYWHIGNANSENSLVILFRAELNEAVQPEALRKAAELAIKRYPSLAVRLCEKNHEIFYLENSSPIPVTPYQKDKHYSLGTEETGFYLFRISFEEKAIRLYLHHSLTDGYGVTEFMKTLLLYYFRACGKPVSDDGMIRINETEWDRKEEMLDGALTYSDLSIPEVPITAGNVVPFPIPEHFFDENGIYSCRRYRIQCSSEAVKKAAEETGTKVTSFISAVIAGALDRAYDGTGKTMIGSVTTNLRALLPSETMNNFSSWEIFALPPELRALPLPVQAQAVSQQIAANHTKEFAVKQLNTKMRGTEKYRAMSVHELFDCRERKLQFKKATRMGLAFLLTNVGVMKLPESMQEYVRSAEICIPSFDSSVTFNILSTKDVMTIIITQCFDSDGIAEKTAEMLKEAGVSCFVEDLGMEPFDKLWENAVLTDEDQKES